ncbi:MAG TPA: proton-conducting transporter membrane subunit [Smithella sp.]|nr:proton-conducting transporter membrane subunit [Smithella sp.]
MNHEMTLGLLILIPAFAGFACLLMPSLRTALGLMCAGVFGTAIIGLFAITSVLFEHHILYAAGQWLFMDALSAYNYFVMLLIFCLSSIYSCVYFRAEMEHHNLTINQIRLFTCLWCEALTAMTIVLLSNNLGIMWVGIEATTLITAFLICVHVSRESLEAMWKYILICSVGVAFAFMGTLLAAASAKGVAFGNHNALLWTTLRTNAAALNPTLIKAAFIFLLVGYGTKAGLAPMHTWLPDAHSQAPAPVSAIFSGFMLNAALYCVMRYVPIVETATGNSSWGLNLIAGFGIISIMTAAVFILFQTDLKRLLAYHSIEHLGIIALGLGLGGLGTFAALFHTLNHSLCKTLSFFAAGRLGQAIGGSHDMEKMNGSMRISPVWGIGIFCSILALIGIAPFALFISEFQLLKAAIDKGATVSLVLFLLGAGIVFIGALGHAIPLAWGRPHSTAPVSRASFVEFILVFAPLSILLLLGIWMPQPLQSALNASADVIRNTVSASASLQGGLP